ncbi:MAG: polysaccharide pyruvyl transferase family protein [Acidobacteria bacterium]|nr:polysaccharide pyruvyl transferase family protein [Acidobacteriota bacterium]
MTTATDSPQVDRSICDLAHIAANEQPFPHLIHDHFIQPESYEQLRRSFPKCPPNTGPTGYSLYWSDKGYQKLLDSEPAWKALFHSFHSQAFIDWAREQFAPWWSQLGCTIDLANARYVPYREDRIDKDRETLRRVEHEPEQLWVRMDIYQGHVGYARATHVDHRRRLLSMLIYFCDQRENQMEGGELLLHDAAGVPVAQVVPRHNLMVAFPCAAQSHHSVPPIRSLAAPRNYIQVQISSSVEIWDDSAEALKRRARHSPAAAYPTHSLSSGSAASTSPDQTVGLEASAPPRLDLEESRAKLLGALRGAADITVIRNWGPLGDQLIHAGVRQLLRGVDYREIGLGQIDGARGDLAIVTGGGAWCGAHQHLPPLLPRIEKQFARTVVFPSSFDTSISTVAKVLGRTRALVFAREFVSYEGIRNLCRADVAHDTAFFFDFRQHRRPGGGTLLAFRKDAEALTDTVPPGNRDIAVDCESLDEFLWTIARHEVVKTDRAHVMIAAALLGKEVYFSASNYHKLPALAACSLQGYPVSFVPDLRVRLTDELSKGQPQAADGGSVDQRVFTSEIERLRALSDERGRVLDEVLNSRSFRIVSAFWRLRSYLSGR